MENIKVLKKYEDNLDDSMNKEFSKGIERLLGDFEVNGYKIERKLQILHNLILKRYIQGQEQQIRLYFTKFQPIAPKATIAIVHGLGEHSGRYMHIADYFASNGFIVIMLDLTGFGISGGARGCSTQDMFHKDVEILLAQARTDLPLFLYGHSICFSMGGGIVLTIGQRNPNLKLAGIIASIILMYIDVFDSFTFHQISKMQKNDNSKNTINKTAIICSTSFDFLIHPQLNLTSLSKNDRVCIDYLQDPNNVTLLSTLAAKSLMEHDLYLLPNCSKQTFPLLICHGEKDGIVDFEQSVEYYEKCGSKDKKLNSFDNGYHELHNDVEYYELRKNILDWCNARIKNASNFEWKELQTGFIIQSSIQFLAPYIIVIFLLVLFSLILKRFI